MKQHNDDDFEAIQFYQIGKRKPGKRQRLQLSDDQRECTL
jgi:hypothetical protein